MVKTPKMRHSKSRREPVTIELEPGAVSRVAGEDAANGRTDEAKAEEAANASQPAAPEEPMHADQTDIEPWEHADAGPEEPAGGGVKGPEGPKPTYPAGSEASADRAFDYSFDDASAKASGMGAEEAPKDAQTGNEDMAAQPKRGGINGIAAGIIGGVIALAAAGGLQFAGLLGAPGAGDASGVSLDGVNGEIASLKTEIAGLKDTAGSNDASAKVDGLSSALDQVKTDVASLKSAVEQGGAGDTAGLAALGDKVRQIETTVAALGQAGNTAPVDLGPINEKLTGLDAAVKSVGEAATAQDGRLAALEQSVSQLSGKVES
ncbi:MAG: phage tail protein, partial [Mesorhizobium sp.]